MKTKMIGSRPSYAYIPGNLATPHPHSSQGYRFKQDPELMKTSEDMAAVRDNFQHAIQLFKDDFFWESHVFFEAEWNALSRRGERAALCSAFILLAAALLKIQSQKLETAARMLASCSAKLSQVSEDLGGVN